ncbi:MAG: nodulation protein NfeD, partial [Elusimicrobia bacterium]|nr:nodulation protein NfeD [Elusimicrobiota bacterium]
MNKKLSKFIIIFIFSLLLGREALAKTILLDIDGPINPIVADYISSGLSEPGASLAIIRMDTPGGLMDSMRLIIKDMEAASFPVVVYVGGSGAHAASAGAFITLAADLAVMASGTTIGSAHPVEMGGQGADGTMESKMVEDAAALMRGLAVRRNRNPEWAEKAVTMSLSATALEALELGVIEHIVENFEELLELLKGKTLTKHNKEFQLSLGSGIKEYDMSFFRKFLNYIANPNFTYILLLIGIYGIIYEFSSPGIGFGAVLGGISLLLALLSFQIIPINMAGLLLIL